MRPFILKVATPPTVLFSSLWLILSSSVHAVELNNIQLKTESQTESTVTTLPVIQLSQSATEQKNKTIAKQQLQQVNGATNFTDAELLRQRKLSSNEDVLGYQPGVYAKSAGNEGVKLSIRGSGVNRGSGAHGSGTYVLIDGIPFTSPSGTPYELLDAAWVDHAEVYRGANGNRVGALTLGGAINFATPTGQDAAKLAIHHERGSFGYQRSHISSGQHIGDLDYFVSLSHADSDGFQQHSSSSAKGIVANVGYQITPDILNRSYLRYRETEHQTPGRITKAQLSDDAEQANPNNVLYNSNRPQPGSVWLANKTQINLHEQGTLDFGLAYHHFPMDLQEGIYGTQVDYDDVTAFMNYQKQATWLGHEHRFKIGVRSTTDIPSDQQIIERYRVNQKTIQAGTETRHFEHTGSDNVLSFNHEFELNPEFWLVTGINLAYMQRQSQVTWPVQSQKVELSEWNWAPSLGLRYQMTPQTQWFANISRSVEAPHPWSMIWSSDQKFNESNNAGHEAAIGRQREPIHIGTQSAHTLELGGRGQSWLGDWDIAYYYSQVKNELLAVELQPAPNQVIAESNASDTIHQGLEIGLNSSLWRHDQYGEVSLKQSYTLSDFHYKNDPAFDKNELAGIPKHFYQAQLQFQHPQGFYAALNTEYASKVAMDYANTHYADHYQIWGATFGYQQAQQPYSAWLDFRNIANKKYASTVTPGFNDQGRDAARLTPGDGFGVYAGVTYKVL